MLHVIPRHPKLARFCFLIPNWVRLDAQKRDTLKCSSSVGLTFQNRRYSQDQWVEIVVCYYWRVLILCLQELLISYNIVVDRDVEQSARLKNTAERVGLSMPKLFESDELPK